MCLSAPAIPLTGIAAKIVASIATSALFGAASTSTEEVNPLAPISGVVEGQVGCGSPEVPSGGDSGSCGSVLDTLGTAASLNGNDSTALKRRW